MELKALAALPIALAVVIFAACSVSGEIPSSSEPANTSVAQPPAVEETPLKNLTPGAVGGDISSSGKTTLPTPSGSGSGALSGSAPGSTTGVPSRSTPSAPDTGWQVYQNETYGFELRYPPAYVIVPAKSRVQPTPVVQVWFQDRGLATSPTANLQPPQFAIDVYDNSSRLSAEDWIQASKILPPGSNFDKSLINVGGVESIRLTSPLLLAPNVFIYVARGSLIYKITPLGTFSDQMLASIKFL